MQQKSSEVSTPMNLAFQLPLQTYHSTDWVVCIG